MQVKAPPLEVCPTPQALHDALPPTLDVPGLHSMHEDEPLVASERLPTGHAEQVVKAPVAYEPLLQGWQQSR